eukprot:COSAG06_NODE_1_length_58652_cov_31.600967_12_plen_274_part_00
MERLNNRIYEHAGEIEDLKYKAELQLQEQMYIMSYVAQRRKLAYADSEAPAAEEIREYASYLGIDPELDAKWLWIAEEAISCPLPPSWEGMQDDNGAPFFYNKQVRACMCASVITAGSSLISLLRHADVVVSLCCVVLCCVVQTDKSQYAHPMDEYFRTLFANLKSVRTSRAYNCGHVATSCCYNCTNALVPLLYCTAFAKAATQCACDSMCCTCAGRYSVRQGQRGGVAHREPAPGRGACEEAGADRQADDDVSSCVTSKSMQIAFNSIRTA